MKQRTGNAITHRRAFVKASLLPVFACLALLLSVAPLRAQVQSGINGTVTDSSQAVISGARITITNNATGVVSNTATSTAGTFNAGVNRTFWDVHNPDNAISIKLRNPQDLFAGIEDRYDEFIVEVEDPVDAVERINRALSKAK